MQGIRSKKDIIYLLIFIPIVGAFLSFLVAAVFIAWDYVDFSLSKDSPFLKDRVKALWQNKFLLIGFGSPLVFPLLGISILPFAILSSTILYYEKMKENVSCPPHSS